MMYHQLTDEQVARVLRDFGPQKIQAIRFYREVTGCGLREAMETVTRVQAGGPLDPPTPETLRAVLTRVHDELRVLVEQLSGQPAAGEIYGFWHRADRLRREVAPYVSR